MLQRAGGGKGSRDGVLREILCGGPVRRLRRLDGGNPSQRRHERREELEGGVRRVPAPSGAAHDARDAPRRRLQSLQTRRAPLQRLHRWLRRRIGIALFAPERLRLRAQHTHHGREHVLQRLPQRVRGHGDDRGRDRLQVRRLGRERRRFHRHPSGGPECLRATRRRRRRAIRGIVRESTHRARRLPCLRPGDEARPVRRARGRTIASATERRCEPTTSWSARFRMRGLCFSAPGAGTKRREKRHDTRFAWKRRHSFARARPWRVTSRDDGRT